MNEIVPFYGGRWIVCCNTHKEWERHPGDFEFFWVFCSECLTLYIDFATEDRYKAWRRQRGRETHLKHLTN